MTTIVYHHECRAIAYDSRLTRGATIVSDEFNKLKTKGNVKFLFCGVEADIQKLVNEYPAISGSLECSGIIIEGGKVYHAAFDPEFKMLELFWSEAWGSGQDHALTAIDLGCSVSDSIEYAKKRDTGTGGKVNTINL